MKYIVIVLVVAASCSFDPEVKGPEICFEYEDVWYSCTTEGFDVMSRSGMTGRVIHCEDGGTVVKQYDKVRSGCWSLVYENR